MSERRGGPAPVAGDGCPRPIRPDTRRQQLRRFWRLFLWSGAGSVVVTCGLWLAVRDLWVAASFLMLLLVMAAFLAAYYALMRIES